MSLIHYVSKWHATINDCGNILHLKLLPLQVHLLACVCVRALRVYKQLKKNHQCLERQRELQKKK